MNKVLEFHENSKEIVYLTSQDERLGMLIKFIGNIRLELQTDYFASLCESIVGQQLSTKAAETIWGRVVSITGEIVPERILDIEAEKLRECGVSRSKISYLKNLSQMLMENKVDLNNIDLLDDEEAIKELTKVKGIGRWTAEMFLIFSLGRLDVFSTADIGLQRSIGWLYNESEDNNASETALKWAPYRTVASLYLWEIINKGLITKFENFDKLINEPCKGKPMDEILRQ